MRQTAEEKARRRNDALERQCTCSFHRYHVVHICACGQIIDHSQATFDEHKAHGSKESFPADLYDHGDTREHLYRKAADYYRHESELLELERRDLLNVADRRGEEIHALRRTIDRIKFDLAAILDKSFDV